ncbi:MAG: YebC/PmpR family DNA-binding transcriptional regulator [Bacteroidetes bacterium]|nr:YebC/PmpR family DNA-binding transcriptional regulator [Bacteroidota bacterium]
MGRAFELRRGRKEKRWGKMSKAFTRLGKEIAISVKIGGGDPAGNPRLRVAIQNAKGVNMPKDRIEAAIKRASSRDEKDFQEIVYEGYAPNGIAIVMDCATDNPTRTVANIRHYLTKVGGSLATAGSLDFLFERKGVFVLNSEGINIDELELELIDFGAEEIAEDDGEIYIYTSFEDFIGMQRELEERGLDVSSADIQRIPTNTVELTEEQAEVVNALIEKIEEDEDVQMVFHNMK